MIHLKEIHIKALTLVVGGKDIYLTLEEAKELHSVLDGIVAEPKEEVWMPADVTYPDSCVYTDENGDLMYNMPNLFKTPHEKD